MADINEAALQAAEELIKQRTPNAVTLTIKCDVSKESEVKQMVDQTIAKFKRLDVMVIQWKVIALQADTSWI